MASRIWNSDRRYSFHHRVTDLFAEVPFTTSGAVNTLTATKNLGIKTVVQAAAAAAAAGGSLFAINFTDAYRRIIGANMTSIGQIPAVSAMQIIAQNSGIAMVTLASAANADYITLVIPGQANIVLTGLTNGGTPTDSQWCVGTGGTANADSATALAKCINNVAATNESGGCALMPTTITAQAVGATVVIQSGIPGVQIKSHNASKERVVTDILNTVDVARTMLPGVVIQTSVGVTATVPASGDVLKFHFTMCDQE